MDVKLETTEGLERKLTITVPAAQVEREVQQKMGEMSRSVRLPGFRPGKVPQKVIQQKFGGRARAEVYDNLLQSTYRDAINDNAIKPAGQPKIELADSDDDVDLSAKDFSYTATIEVYPEFDIKGLDKLKVDKPVCEISDADLNEMLENLQKQRTEFTSVERASAAGDQVKINFKGTIKGEDFPGNSGDDVDLRLEEGTLPEVFDEPFRKALMGQEKGAEVSFKVKFPKDYGLEEVAGKTADYAATVLDVSEATVPELNDEFATSFGMGDGGLEQLKTMLRERMQEEAEEKVRGKLKEQVLDSLLIANPVELPKVMINNEIGQLRNQAMQQMGIVEEEHDHDPDHVHDENCDHDHKPKLPDEMFTAQAERRVALGLVLGKLIQEKELRADPARLTKQMQRIAMNYENPQEIFKAYQSNPQAMASLEMSVLEEQVVDLLVESAEVSENSISFKDLTEQAQAA